jgi:hypothetical protein
MGGDKKQHSLYREKGSINACSTAKDTQPSSDMSLNKNAKQGAHSDQFYKSKST